MAQPLITIRLDTRKVSRMLSDLQRKQLPFATSMALNQVAFIAQNAERAAIPTIFKSPRPFTQKSVQVTKASKTKLVSSVFIRPEVAAYLDPFEFGGVHVVPGAQQLVPKTMRLDRYGQITRATLKKLNELANDPKSGVFFAEIHGVRGYWLRPVQQRGTQRTGGFGTKGKLNAGPGGRKTSLTLIAREEQPMPVTEHLDFIQNASHQVAMAWPLALQNAMGKALASAH